MTAGWRHFASLDPNHRPLIHRLAGLSASALRLRPRGFVEIQPNDILLACNSLGRRLDHVVHRKVMPVCRTMRAATSHGRELFTSPRGWPNELTVRGEEVGERVPIVSARIE